MGAYLYQALKKSGNTCKGVIEADSERHARQLLREMALIPTHIQTLKIFSTGQIPYADPTTPRSANDPPCVYFGSHTPHI